MKKNVCLVLKMVVILAMCIVSGAAALTIVFSLPVERMKMNAASSIDVFYTESVYPQQSKGYKASQLDNETDAIMILGAINGDKKHSPLYKAMAVSHITMEKEHSLCNTLVKYLWENKEPDGNSNYDRYWHGYMVYLKPLLLFMDYSDIRMLNMIIQICLLLLLIFVMMRKNLSACLPALGMLLIVLNPAAVAMSLQLSSIYYIIICSLILLIYNYERLREGSNLLYFFLLIGIFTAYFDFLTYPIAAFCVPACMSLAMDESSWKSKLKKILICGISWGGVTRVCGLENGCWAVLS